MHRFEKALFEAYQKVNQLDAILGDETEHPMSGNVLRAAEELQRGWKKLYSHGDMFEKRFLEWVNSD